MEEMGKELGRIRASRLDYLDRWVVHPSLRWRWGSWPFRDNNSSSFFKFYPRISSWNLLNKFWQNLTINSTQRSAIRPVYQKIATIARHASPHPLATHLALTGLPSGPFSCLIYCWAWNISACEIYLRNLFS